jgi:glycerol kinase
VPVLLGIDQGTSGTRAVVYDETLVPRGDAYREVTPTHPAPGLVEHDAGTLLESLLETAGRALCTAGVDA